MNKPSVAQGTDYRAPGNILARHRETGVKHYIRPAMLKIEDHPWEVIGDTPVVEPEIKTGKPTSEPSVILTGSGKPFKTETAARSAMTKKKLDENLWVIMETQDGFIISKV